LKSDVFNPDILKHDVLWVYLIGLAEVAAARILIFAHPGSRIQKQQQKRGAKKLVFIPFFSHKFHKIVNYFIFEMLKKKLWDSFQRIIEFFIQKFITKLSKIWVWYLVSEIRDPGVQGSKRHRIPDPGSGSATLPCMMV
jgi:hypothetical protein